MIMHWARTLTLGLVALSFTPAALALIVNDRWPGDLNTITGTVEDDVLNELQVSEDYNEDNLVPYPSPDGYAVVNLSPEPGCPAGTCYFDKLFQLEADDLMPDVNGKVKWGFDFRATNTSPYAWSDYHLEIYDSTFTNLLNIVDLIATGNIAPNPLHPLRNIMNNSVWFWGGIVPVGAVSQYVVVLDLTGYVAGQSIGIRQIATTTPEPGSLALWALGLASLGMVGWRQRQG